MRLPAVPKLMLPAVAVRLPAPVEVRLAAPRSIELSRGEIQQVGRQAECAARADRPGRVDRPVVVATAGGRDHDVRRGSGRGEVDRLNPSARRDRPQREPPGGSQKDAFGRRVARRRGGDQARAALHADAVGGSADFAARGQADRCRGRSPKVRAGRRGGNVVEGRHGDCRRRKRRVRRQVHVVGRRGQREMVVGSVRAELRDLIDVEVGPRPHGPDVNVDAVARRAERGDSAGVEVTAHRIEVNIAGVGGQLDRAAVEGDPHLVAGSPGKRRPARASQRR